jgi:hypothetical protein
MRKAEDVDPIQDLLDSYTDKEEDDHITNDGKKLPMCETFNTHSSVE